MRAKPLLIAALLLSVSPFAAYAGPTQADADKLKAVLQSYFGAGTDAVKIVPEGDGYKMSFDLSGLAKAMQAKDTEASVQSFDFSLTPEGGGKWKVHHDGPMGFSLKSKDQLDIAEKVESMTLDGEFDEALGSFTNLVASGKNISVKESVDDSKGMKIDVDAKFDSVDTKLTGAATAAGGVDVKFNYNLGHGEMTQDFNKEGDPPLHLVIGIDGGTSDGTITGTKTLEILQLIKFLNAHVAEDSLGKDQAAFKLALTNLMPGFNNLAMRGGIGKTTVLSPLGTFGVDKVGVTFEANGAVKDGKFAESLSFEGLSVPANIVPAWASSLVTKNFNIGFAVTGYDLESAAKAEIAAADFTKDPPISKEIENKIGELLLPKGAVNVVLSNTMISNDTYKITIDGAMDAGPNAKPSGKAHITAKGLDDIMKAMQAAPPESGIQGGAAVIVVAKGMGKAESDGSTSWDVEATPDGKITVNGIDLSKMAK